MADSIYLGIMALLIGCAVVGSGPYPLAQNWTILRLLAGAALIIFGLLRLFHIV